MYIYDITEIVKNKAFTVGITQTAIPFLNLYRFSESEIALPNNSNPYLYFVVEGFMRLHTPSGIMDYVKGQYSISAIDTPEKANILATAENGNFYSLSLSFTLDDVMSVMLQLDDELTIKISEGQLEENVVIDADNQIVHSIYRLLYLLDSPSTSTFISNNMKLEILYYVLCGSCGKQFLQSMIGFQSSGEIYQINNWIKRNFRESFSVESLAQRQNISVSLLHQKFKSAVGMGILQCQKRLRLTEARRLMLDEDKNVTEAAFDVGYESVSQFTREYKRMFGNSPKEDIQQLKSYLKK